MELNKGFHLINRTGIPVEYVFQKTVTEPFVKIHLVRWYYADTYIIPYGFKILDTNTLITQLWNYTGVNLDDVYVYLSYVII